MPRTSKYAVRDASRTQTIWRAGLYIRLSREDGDKEESESVASQRALLSDFVDLAPDIEPCGVYVDDGFTGTNFDRPDFARMMEDVRARAINCVIVKDLSRLGRNYIEVGRYIENIFPFLNVRFISVGDMLDSVGNPQAMNTLIVPFKNLINDEYCRDISNKVRASLDLRRRQGQFIGSFAAYGYGKDPADHHHLVIDDEAARVVRDIYQWFISGMSVLGIARRLNASGVPNPTAYKEGCGLATHRAGGASLWQDSSVRRILQNRVYTGCLVQGRNRTRSYKLQTPVPVPEREWFISPGAHEAIISTEDFEKAQRLFLRDTRAAPGTDRVSPLSGFVKCADCGRAMNRKTISRANAAYGYYICSTFKMDKTACTKHTIRSDALEAAVLETLRKQIELAVEMDALLAKAAQRDRARDDASRLARQLADVERERARVEAMKLALYPDWKNGDLTREEYLALKAQFDARIAAADARIASVKNQSVDAGNPFLQSFIKHRNLQALTREALVELVEEVRVHEGGAITIRFAFSDLFQEATDQIKAL